MANSEYNYIPTYIRRTINNRPKDVVTAKYWNELFNLLITQGDHTAEELGNILNYFSTRLVDAESEIAESAEAIANIREVFRINVTYSGGVGGVYSADKTFAEIKDAYDAGQLPYVVYGGDTIYTLSLCSFESTQMFMDFERCLVGDGILEAETLRIYSYITDSGSNVVKRIDEFKMPTSLKNPNALTFTGGATGSYDGSEPKTVDIPVIPYEVINKNTAARHTHINKSVLDSITADDVAKWDETNCTTYIKVDSTDDVISTVNGETYADIQALINDGKPVVVRFADVYDFYYFETFGFSDSSGNHIRLNFRCDTGGIVFTLTLKDDNTWAFSQNALQTCSITDSGGYFTSDTVEGALQEIGAKLAQEPLSGTTSELTPTQVYNAVSAGIPVKVQYTNSTYGLIEYTNFTVAESMGIIAANIIAYYNGEYILAVLSGDKTANIWAFKAANLAKKTDIPADDHINSLIDTKLGVIENGFY